MNYLVLLFSLCFFKTISTDINPKVIIIGSGASGIAAASRLLENGINNVIILEADNRFGGRVNTSKLGEYWIDLGSQWVHGEAKNVVYELASPLGLLSKSMYPGGPEPPKLEVKFYSPSGDELSEERSQSIVNFVGLVQRETSTDQAGSYGDFVEKRYDEFAKNHPEFTPDFKDDILTALELIFLAGDTAKDWHKLSLEAGATYDEYQGYQSVNWRDRAYGTILDILMKRYPNPEEELPVLNKTLLNKKVTKINYQGDGPVEVTTQDGSQYTADHVIFTPSLGVLKAEHEKIFDPPLPGKKKEAIEKLGFGKNAKIILYFDEPWWQSQGRVFHNIVWSKEARREIENDPDRSWMLGTAYGVNVAYKPKLYLLWLTGIHAKEMERIPDELFRNQTVELLQKFFGKTHNITTPRDIRRSMWNTNENYRGTYSYITTDAFNSDRKNKELMEPIMRQNVPVLQFAGEATSINRYATIDGAIATGWREADRIIKFYNKSET